MGLAKSKELAMIPGEKELLFNNLLSIYHKFDKKSKQIALKEMLKSATYFSQYLIVHDKAELGSELKKEAFCRMFDSAVGFYEWNCVHDRATDSKAKSMALRKMFESANCFCQYLIVRDNAVRGSRLRKKASQAIVEIIG